MPTNIVIASTAISASVRAAIVAEGALKAGTPSDTASTPVIAVHPLANADSRTNSVMAPVPSVGSGSTGSTGETVPLSTW